jgi:hypothetical protein
VIRDISEGVYAMSPEGAAARGGHGIYHPRMYPVSPRSDKKPQMCAISQGLEHPAVLYGLPVPLAVLNS